MKKLALHWQVIIALVLGGIFAYYSIVFDWNDFTNDYIAPFGTIFINVLKLIAVPMVLFSIIAGVASLKDISKLGKMGIRTLLMYVGTTMIAVCLGLLLVNLIQPGSKVTDEMLTENRIAYELWQSETDGVAKLDSLSLSTQLENQALVEKVKHKLDTEVPNDWVQDKLKKAAVAKNTGPLQPLVDIFPKNIFFSFNDGTGGSKMLQIIFFAIFFGLILISIPKEKAEPVAKLVDGLNEVFVKMILVVMKAMPFFVFCLTAGQIVETAGKDPEKFQELIYFLGWYSIVVVAGLLFMAFVFYPTLVTLLIKPMKYLFFLKGMRDAQFTAFSTSSSVATLPITMKSVNEKLGVSQRTSSFVLPIGATINMDGTSLYQAVAVVAMAQFHMIDLTFAQQLVIIFTATLASIGAAAVPSAGLVLMIIVLESVGLNPAWIGLIFPIDRILDMCRTLVNVTGDGAVSTIIANSEGELNIPKG